ncbi:MAG: hypothetical protein QOJ09_1945 [Actinomycetota bacterium]|jgi:hypothetical protein|nr:hypothetical protein [Actinomycetota bacterium]
MNEQRRFLALLLVSVLGFVGLGLYQNSQTASLRRELDDVRSVAGSLQNAPDVSSDVSQLRLELRQVADKVGVTTTTAPMEIGKAPAPAGKVAVPSPPTTG